ncbi:MAG: CRISPR-associated endonuclease Cas1 [Candidatus Auribacter fodinae]|uniref:CRISPR-associated endonuclease Cas1 n=1 Tax=Candidatus Auribacter fodinae TaxID=2093366 RepID=A0A3A4R5K6_9BACT|nr:MAG: CRISPR-associated endonuclease Cas1 [Candidatus Auribacter fodinae]
MQLVIDDFGTFVKKKQNRFEVARKEKTEEFSADKVSQIVLLKKGTISGSAVALAMEKNIDVVYLDSFGKPIARIFPCTLGGTTLIRRRQAEATASLYAVPYVRAFVKSKMLNQAALLKSLNKTRNGLFLERIREIERIIEKSEDAVGDYVDDLRSALIGYEGNVAAIYFDCIRALIPFGRRKRGAKDRFNSALNYAYGILYSQIEKACLLAGLDPYLGFVHSDRYGKPSLVLDFIEQFRQPIADRAVITIFVKKELADDSFIEEEIVQLSSKGKKKIVEAIYGRLSSEFTHNGKKMTFEKVIIDKAREFAGCILEMKEYEPFVHRW